MSLFNSELRSLKLLHRGKVRDLYAGDEARLLITDGSHFRFRCGLADANPWQGASAHIDVAVLVQAALAHHPESSTECGPGHLCGTRRGAIRLLGVQWLCADRH